MTSATENTTVEAIKNKMPRSGEAGALGDGTGASFFLAMGAEVMKSSKK
jgi:hypothetical protein